MNARLMLLAVLLIMPLAQTGHAQQPEGKFEPVGRWRFFHTDGTPFTARLAADQSAATDWEGGEHGIWRWEGGTVRVIYTDGWDDQLVQTASGVFTKRGWSPDADRCGPASNQTGAERISSDPGPPL
jgi:hypothetical protein